MIGEATDTIVQLAYEARDAKLLKDLIKDRADTFGNFTNQELRLLRELFFGMKESAE